jgi:hypothetical protein
VIGGYLELRHDVLHEGHASALELVKCVEVLRELWVVDFVSRLELAEAFGVSVISAYL